MDIERNRPVCMQSTHLTDIRYSNRMRFDWLIMQTVWQTGRERENQRTTMWITTKKNDSSSVSSVSFIGV